MTHSRPVLHRRWKRRRVLGLVALGVVVAGAVVVGVRATRGDGQPNAQVSGPPKATSAPMQLKTVEGPPIPPRGAYLGAWVYPRPDNQQGKVSSVVRFEKTVGKQLDIVHLYRKWGMPIGTASDLAFARSGKYLLLSLAGTDMRRIAGGQEDAMIVQIARQVAALPTKVFLAFRTEMNRPNLKDLVHSPHDFIAAWDHFRAIFAAQRVSNVAWTWCPTALGFDDGSAQAYYPGDRQVDWICADVYPKTPWRAGDDEAFSTLTHSFLKWSAQHQKPIMIGEMAVGVSYGPRRGPWITAAGRFIQDNPQIKAIVWFDQSLPEDPDFYRYALEGDPPAVRAFAELAQNGYFGMIN